MKELRGRLVLVEFWSYHDERCRLDFLQTVPIYNRYQPLGFEIIGVNLDDNRRYLNRFIEAVGIRWPMAHDRYRITAKEWGVTNLPARVLVDQNGLVVADQVGPRNLEVLIRKYLNLPPLR